MPEYRFQTHEPVDQYVEIGKGSVEIRCLDTTESTITIDGSGADDVQVEQVGDVLRVQQTRRTGFFRDSSLAVVIVVPLGSNTMVKTGSADITVRGAAGHAQLRSGSGDVAIEEVEGGLLVETGSGDVRADRIRDARIKCGSGDIVLGETAGSLQISTGSGDVRVDDSLGVCGVKTGSGDLHLRHADGEVTYSTGSGDLNVEVLERGRVQVKGASGDVAIGVRAGLPVWTDVTTTTGEIHSDLRGAGEPVAGQDHHALQIRTVTGDIVLTEIGVLT